MALRTKKEQGKGKKTQNKTNKKKKTKTKPKSKHKTNQKHGKEGKRRWKAKLNNITMISGNDLLYYQFYPAAGCS